MKNKKKKYFFGIIAAFLIMAVVIFNIKNKAFKNSDAELNGLPVYYSHAVYAFDTSTPEKAYGASKYVFIAKVNGILRTEYINPTEVEVGIGKTEIVYDPVTVYSISVIKNIKGNLITSESIELKQHGGISKDNKSYTFVENSSLLNTGEYYMFLTGAEENGGILEATNPERIISLGNDLNLINNVQSKKIVSKNIESKATKKVVEKIENYIFVEEEIEPERPNNSARIPVLDNISKYDVNYNN